MPTEPAEELSLEEFTLRPGAPDDLDHLSEVFLAATSGPDHPPLTRSPEEVRDWCLSLLDREDRDLWVAAREEVPLGFVAMDGPWVDLLFVHPGRPARGVGAALLDLAKGMHPHGFGLRVHQANERARAFYVKHGLIELERTDGSSYADGEPDLQMVWPGEEPLVYLRGRIDTLDDELAVHLARRTALTAAVQDHKAATGSQSGPQGRDAEREAEIVARMARHVPELGAERIARVMRTVIEESLAAWESGRWSGPG